MRGQRWVLLCSLLAFGTAAAARPPEKVRGRAHANYDARGGPAVRDRAATLTANPTPALSALESSLGGHGVVAIDGLTGTPRFVGRLDGFLTGPSRDPGAKVALDYVRANAAVFQVDVSTLELAREYVSEDGTQHLWWRQVVNGVPVFGNGLKANVTSNGELINVSGAPLSNLSGAAVAPSIGADEALAHARRNVGAPVLAVGAQRSRDRRQTTVFDTGERAQLAIFATPRGNRLGWDLLVEPSGNEMYRQVVDAQTGEVLFRQSLVNDAHGLAFRNYPGAPAGGTQESFDLSGKAWLAPSATILSGPNAQVYTDVNANNVADQSEQINPSSPSTNDWLWPLQTSQPAGIPGCASFVCTWDPGQAGSWATNKNQSGTQLFVLINTFHDHLRASPIGFTPAAGNFEGNDPVRGEALDGAKVFQNMPDGAHIDNANFATPPDGTRPRMQMFLWHQPGVPDDPFNAADGANEADIVYHEYTHGLSNRLVIDADGFSTLGDVQAGAMGEAWGDWYGMDFLNKQGLQPDQPGKGDVRIGHYVGGGQDLIRTEPIDCKIGMSAAQGCPGGAATGAGGYTYGDYGRVIGSPEVHADGEIWAQTLWDLRDAIGSDAAEALVTRAMELSPFNPSFLDERNAILQADLVLNGGARQSTIWSVFAARGMGWFAGTIDGDDTSPVESFSLPPRPNARTGTLHGIVSDVDTAARIEGAIVALGGHDHGAGNYVAVSDSSGNYSISNIFTGTYPKVNVRAEGGYETLVSTLTIKNNDNVRDFALRRDWAAAAGGGSIAAFNGPDYTAFGCGPINAIDLSAGSGWGSDTDVNAQITGVASDKFIVVKLPNKVNVTGLAVNPSNTCGDPGSSSTRGWRIEASADGVTFTPVNAGVFYLGNRGHLNTVFTGSIPGVQYVRFWILNPQVPAVGGAACTGPADCGTAPDDDSNVAAQCGAGKPNAFGGCQFMDMVELAVYGTQVP